MAFNYAKIKPVSWEGKEWSGYLTPCEILALAEAGCKPTPSNAGHVEDARKAKAKGDCTPRWFYFTLSKEWEGRMGSAKARHGRAPAKR